MKPAVVSDVLAVGEVPSREQIEILARAGFKSLINNQPDGELDRMIRSADIEASCRALGLAYRYIPLGSRTPPEAELAAFTTALGELPPPIYAFCYSGSRSAAACAIVLAREQDSSAIIRSFADAGYDISGLRAWLDAERSSAAHVAANGSHGAEAPAAPNGAPAAGGGGTATETPAPAYQPIIVLPRAASFGGFAM